MALSTVAAVRFAVSLILSVVGTLGNVCALVVVTKSPALRKRSNAFLVNLSFVDFLVTAVVMPMFLLQAYYQSWPSTDGSCQASWVYFAVFCGIGGIIILPVPLAYYHIYRSVRRARQRIHAAPPTDRQNTTQHGPCSRSVHSKEELRITKVALLVSLEVMITCLPGCINLMLQQAIPAAVPAWRYISILLLVKSAINPYLYGWINKHYMNAYRKVFAPCFRNSQPSENSDYVDNNLSNNIVFETNKQSS
ncbi:uncharacterized protein [Diadema antillarum]|uniref:uncharacterized protein n=1 Tax=Diadema antillarum TaxID=105358 RepID=UPI003A8C316B